MYFRSCTGLSHESHIIYNEIGKKDTVLFIEMRNWDSRRCGGTVPAFLSP